MFRDLSAQDHVRWVPLAEGLFGRAPRDGTIVRIQEEGRWDF